MSDEMTSVYSGGLMYEYAMEENGFGIAELGPGGVKEDAGFSKFASALSAHPAPTGDGGYTSTTHSVSCPTAGGDWLVDSTLLPAIPDGAKAVSTRLNAPFSIMLMGISVHERWSWHWPWSEGCWIPELGGRY